MVSRWYYSKVIGNINWHHNKNCSVYYMCQHIVEYYYVYNFCRDNPCDQELYIMILPKPLIFSACISHIIPSLFNLRKVASFNLNSSGESTAASCYMILFDFVHFFLVYDLE